MKIKEGEKLPDSKLFIINEGHKEISTREILNKDKVILFGLPGAFTPACSKKHVPSFLESTEKLKKICDCNGWNYARRPELGTLVLCYS